MKRFVEPLGTDADPPILTLALQALQMHDEVDEALRLFGRHLHARTASAQHLTVLLDLLRPKYRRGVYKEAPSGGRVQQGLDIYLRCVAPDSGMKGAAGSVILANAALVLLNSGASDMLRQNPHWLDAAKGIFQRFRGLGMEPNQAMYGQLIMLTAKTCPQGEALSAARELYAKEGLTCNHWTLNAMTFAALEVGDWVACKDIFESGTGSNSVPPADLSQYQGAFQNYLTACIRSVDLERGLAALEQWDLSGPPRSQLYLLSQMTRLLSMIASQEPKQSGGDWQEWHPVHANSSEVKKAYPSPELRRLQVWATHFLTDLVVAALSKPHLVRELPLWVLSPTVAAHVLFIGHVEALLAAYPRPQDYTAGDRIEFLRAEQTSGDRESWKVSGVQVSFCPAFLVLLCFLLPFE